MKQLVNPGNYRLPDGQTVQVLCVACYNSNHQNFPLIYQAKWDIDPGTVIGIHEGNMHGLAPYATLTVYNDAANQIWATANFKGTEVPKDAVKTPEQLRQERFNKKKVG